MKAIIFAGGVGTRLWPLSRKKSPKQFEKIIGQKSTLQLTVERMRPEFKPEDIFISTGKQYVDTIQKQLPFLSKENILGEPYKKDVGPAVAYAMAYISHKFGDQEPVVILWSDHLVKKLDVFKKILIAAGKVIEEERNKIVFIGQKPRFASDNLGWIEFGFSKNKKDDFNFYSFEGFKYKPNKELAHAYFGDKKHCWNLGYFVSTPKFILNMFERFAPEISKRTRTIQETMGKASFSAVLEKEYQDMPSINFDNAVLEQLEKENAYVIVEDIGWSDVGAWEALKEALEKHKNDNIVEGEVLLEGSQDNLVYNFEKGTLVVGIDLENLLVINTRDVTLVAKKTSVSKIKKIVESFEGTDNEHLT